MATCPKCGSKVTEEMAFCPKCGAPLKAQKPPAQPAAAPAPAQAPYRAEKGEKGEKGEKAEKEEKGEKGETHEKRGWMFMGPLIGGLILIFLGFMAYLQIYGILRSDVAGATFLVIIGIVIIIAAIYAVMVTSKRYPRT